MRSEWHGGIELRYQAGDLRYPNRGEELDEVCARDAFVHLEQMDDDQWALIIEAGGHRVCIFLIPRNGRAHIQAKLFWAEDASTHPAP